ncbi:hypothetical protein F4802DRAFT_603419 [Xylaria palmicola]|nr:hypothetical protein F4802DRAFT_603419 [Xylaria palmicola]
MKPQTLLVTALAATGTPMALPGRHDFNPGFCVHARGVYDVCDTEHSFIRCDGHQTLLIADCKLDASSYCQVVDGRARCDGTTPPDLGGGEFPSCEAVAASHPARSMSIQNLEALSSYVDVAAQSDNSTETRFLAETNIWALEVINSLPAAMNLDIGQNG